MKKILHSVLFIGIAVMASCKKDESAPLNPVIGEWLLGEYTYTNLSSDFSNMDGFTGSAYFGEDSYKLVLNEDFTYTRELVFTNSPIASEEGDWESDGEDLILDPDGSGIEIIEDFKIEEVDAKDMKLSAEINDRLVQDIYSDTISQAYLDYLDVLKVENSDLYKAELDKILKLTSLTLVYDFDKTND